MKRSRLIAFLLTAMMLLSTAATGVFALDETGTPEPTADNDTEVVLDNPDTPENDSTTVDGEVTPAPAEGETAPAAMVISRFEATPNGNSFDIAWDTSSEEASQVTHLKYTKDGDTDGTLVEIGETEKTDGEMSLNNLEYATKYNLKLLKKDGDSETVLAEIDETTGENPTPAAPTLYAYPSYHSVYLEWTPSANATKYALYRNNVKIADNIPASSQPSYTDTNNVADTTYWYQVVAYNGNVASPVSNVAAGARVRTCYYRITFKKAVKLTSHDGTKTKHTFQKGQVVYADGFSQGKYQFTFEGHRYHAKWMRIKKPSGDYATNAYENGVTPTRYVNQAGFSSPTGYLIWISLFSQRVYIFQSSAKGWVLVNRDEFGNDGWLCGSGKAKTPTPTGVNKSLHKKMKKYSKHKWWNCFSGNNAIHGSNGQKEIRKLGRLISNGCVRVTNDQAIWIFNNVPKGTRVVVF